MLAALRPSWPVLAASRQSSVREGLDPAARHPHLGSSQLGSVCPCNLKKSFQTGEHVALEDVFGSIIATKPGI